MEQKAVHWLCCNLSRPLGRQLRLGLCHIVFRVNFRLIALPVPLHSANKTGEPNA